jgi:signal transduction histidine kinase/CheY-like chemotaxis protein
MEETSLCWLLLFCIFLAVIWVMVLAFIISNYRQNKTLKAGLQKSLSADTAKTRYLSNMDHEIRTPLNTIIGLAELSRLEIGKDPGKVQDYNLKIIDNSRRLLDLLNYILDESLAGTGSAESSLSVFDLAQLLAFIMQLYSGQCEKSGINFRINCDSIKDSVLWGNELYLKQIFMNLISNAIRFTEKAQHITVTVKEVTELRQPVQPADNEVWFEFIVADTGSGIPEQKLSSLFNSQISDNDFLFRDSKDSGLGLVIVNRLVRMMRGTVGVRSSEGRGSEFTVCIPFIVPDEKTIAGFKAGRRPAGGDSLPEETLKRVDFSGRKILLVEKDSLAAEVAVRLLECVGATVTSTGSYEEGIRIFENSSVNEYDAILSALTVPETAGYDFARTVRSSSRSDSTSVPVFALTENAFTGELNAVLDAGMNGCIVKPLEPASVYAALKASFT